MALVGNLHDFSFLQLLNLINLAKKSGALVIEESEQIRTLFFRQGKLAYVMVGAEPMPLIRVMSRMKLIPRSQAAQLGERYKSLSDKEMGILLLNSGFLTQEQIFSGLGAYCREVILAMIDQKEGFFHFEVNALPPVDCISIRLDLENLIIEGSRLIREMEDLSAEIPDLDLALKFAERPGLNIRNLQLNAEEWRIVSYVNPKNSIRQIADAAKLNEIQARRVVYSLLQAGLVEMVRPDGKSSSPAERTLTRSNMVEQRSLVTRVINRIKAI